jgi:hypothetical protein
MAAFGIGRGGQVLRYKLRRPPVYTNIIENIVGAEAFAELSRDSDGWTAAAM